MNPLEKYRRIAKLLIRILITTTLLVWVFSKIDLQQFGQAVKTANWQYLVVLWILTVLFFWVRSVKMNLILKKQNCHVSVPTIFGVSAMTALYSLVMPGMLSTGAKWYILKKNTGKGMQVFGGMVYNQLSIIVIMTIFGLAALIVTNPTSLLMPAVQKQWLLPVVSAVVLIAIVVLSILLLSRRTGGKVVRVMSFMLKPFSAGVEARGKEVLNKIAFFQMVGWRFHLLMACFTITASLCGAIISYVLSAKAANITAPLSVFVWLATIIYVLGRLPISIGNLGVREGVLALFLSVYGVETSAAILMSMTLFSAVIFMAIIGAIYQIFWSAGMKKSTGSLSQRTQRGD